jgi:hypothetical protein
LTALLTVTWNVCPLSLSAMTGVVNEALVAPEMGAPFSLHWYWSGAVPLATTVKIAVRPIGAV